MMSDVVTMTYDPLHTAKEMKVWFDRKLLVEWSNHEESWHRDDGPESEYYLRRKQYKDLRSRFSESLPLAGFDQPGQASLTFYRNPAVDLDWETYLGKVCKILSDIYHVTINVRIAVNDHPLFTEYFDEANLAIDLDKE